ncbi:MAG: sugar ABC transporter substrate-binding protein [Bacteroidota bacterium]|nr:sugar ABC transporter substrate-binding protein [Ignavibacteria bacterium]MCU7511165.1 sugar ABC transporter substrate-binding protein [Ignavibacteria bacterium]MCU7518711.1 sugar ABC transporter substrate-binding protein [Ignavibacteria bacterium]MCU7522886.1 sugar ABC transporter substrate-binding protein [Ignavibacteria bacterium]
MKFTVKILLICLSFLSMSCRQQAERKVTITFWAMGAEGETVQKLVPAFENLNPGIHVKIQMIPWTTAQEKLITAYASGNTPDGCQLGNTWVPQFEALNSLENLDKWIKSSNVIQKDKYFPGIWDTNVLRGSTFGIPWYIDTRLLFYRTDILALAGYKNPPKTWAELYDVSKKIKALAGESGRFAIYLPTSNEWAPFIIFGLQNGSDILKDNGRYGDFSNIKFREAFEYLIKFHKEGLSPVGISQVTNVYQAFRDGYFAMYISGPWNIREFEKWMTGPLKDKWMTAALPSPTGNKPGLSLAGGSSLVIFKESPHKKEVWKFFEYLSSTQVQLRFYKEINDLPALKEAWHDSSITGNKYMKAFFIQFQNVVATPKVPEWEEIVFSKVQQYAELAARNVMPESQALKALDHDVDNILEKRRWLLSR